MTGARRPGDRGAVPPRHRRAHRGAVAALVLLALGASCSSGSPVATRTDPAAGTSASASGAPATAAPASTTTLPPALREPAPPHRFETRTETFVDPSRPTAPGSATPGTPDRTLVTTIRIPDAPGPRPLIVFSHGLTGHPRKFTALLDRWAEQGYVVAAPAFPLTNDEVPGSPANWTGLAEQPGDVSFVLDRMLAGNDDPASPWSGRIDPDRIGAAGLSLGGATTYGVVFNDCCRDPRFTAAMVLSGALLPPGGGEPRLDGHVPLLIVHGDADLALPYTMAVDAYTRAAGPVWFVTYLGGTHAPPFEDDPSPFDELSPEITTQWWDAELGGDPGALVRFEQAVEASGRSTLQQK